ncbi:uncharacterized protein LACBIDRAFT_310660 [Laccaria bicolor S238N-H82]|uniref:Predicted protein n=1 Tax=Laccaria bicolor (strain S238N-H82 / ATCC MYA-4686) TaxID=486041 RepID=B0DUU0_LACBS|nr:uncharacterized protein LACBIDRAFT_310660 [Laccaria bicolor S238N-H82]EDR01604.1 predicted protein [Laccaria bicolor S238N-H82]|eukprot:XP_001887680.1 predicted protein [Laccaria bicolor S238N-H82]
MPGYPTTVSVIRALAGTMSMVIKTSVQSWSGGLYGLTEQRLTRHPQWGMASRGTATTLCSLNFFPSAYMLQACVLLLLPRSPNTPLTLRISGIIVIRSTQEFIGSHKSQSTPRSVSKAAIAAASSSPAADEHLAKNLRKFASAHTALLGWAGFQALQLKRVPANIRQNALLIDLSYHPHTESHRR